MLISDDMIHRVLSQLGYCQPLSVTQFQNEEDEGYYSVWRVDYDDRSYVLKQAKGDELGIYQTFFTNPCTYAPHLYATTNADGIDYILMEYIPGNNLMRCTRDDLVCTLNSMISMQAAYWDCKKACIPENRINRRKYLNNPRLEAAYDAYLQAFFLMPATLCHDDLLPFNVQISDGRAVFIDWEAAGFLPYPTSLARLIAHGEEDENSFFYMRNEDKTFAIDYYYQHFVSKKGIDRREFDRSLDLCLLYECCEWVFVGNKYGDTENERFRKYHKRAMEQAKKLGF